MKRMWQTRKGWLHITINGDLYVLYIAVGRFSMGWDR